MNEQLNTLDAFKINPHSIYQSGENQIVCCLNMFEFANYQFNSAFVIQNLDHLEKLCIKSRDEVLSEKEKLIDYARNGLIDSIKISLCFENIAKALLLAGGHLIHKIDKNKWPDLAKKQVNEPTLIEEFQDKWVKNPKITSDNKSLNRTLNGVTFNTINYNLILTKSNYNSRLKLNDELMKQLIELNKQRNGLHLHNALSFKLNNRSYQQYSDLKKSVEYFSKNAKEKLSGLINLSSDNTNPTFSAK